MYKCLLLICLMAILFVPVSAMADQISGDQIRIPCENYKPGSETWKTGCRLYAQSSLPWDTDGQCPQKCQQLYSDCRTNCVSAVSLPPEQWGLCQAACLYAANLCARNCKPYNPNAQ